jgi:DNA polymerase
MAKITTLSCDIETYSSIDLTKCGVYRYCESPDFEVLLFGYCVDGGEVQVIDLACGEKIPPDHRIRFIMTPPLQNGHFNASSSVSAYPVFLGFLQALT